MKIGILTYHRAYNYGAYLQASALCQRLNQEEDLEAELIDFCMVKEKKFYATANYGLKRKLIGTIRGTYGFSKKLENTFIGAQKNPVVIKSDRSLVSDSIEDFAAFVKGKYDLIIAGSDEIWKADGMRGFPTPYWLPGDLGCRKMSYAASARVDFDKVLSEDKIKLLEEYLSDFDYISVRDELTKEQIEKHTDKEVHLNCDPSFLYDFETPELDLNDFLPPHSGYDAALKTVLVMVDERSLAGQVTLTLGGKYNLISMNKANKGMINIPNLEPLQWLALLKQVDFVITSLFHGACFSTVLNRPFLAVGTRRRKSKLAELLSDDAFKGRYIETEDLSSVDFAPIVGDLMTEVDFTEVVQRRRAGFEAFLAAARQ